MKNFGLVALAVTAGTAFAQPARTSPPTPPPWVGKRIVFANTCGKHSFSFDEAKNRILVGQAAPEPGAPGPKKSEQIDGAVTLTTTWEDGKSVQELFTTNGRKKVFVALDLYGATPGKNSKVRMTVDGDSADCEAFVGGPQK